MDESGKKMKLKTYTENEMNVILSNIGAFAKNFLDYECKPYHNFRHAVQVKEMAEFLANEEGINKKDSFLLSVACYLHDAVNHFGEQRSFSLSDEERTARMVEAILPSYGLFDEEINVVSNLIRSTEYYVEPKNTLQAIIKDADLSNLGTDQYWHWSFCARLELGIEDDKKFYTLQKNFLGAHKFYTSSAKKHLGPKKQENYELVLKKLDTL